MENLSIRQTLLLENCAAHDDKTHVIYFFTSLHSLQLFSRTGEISFLNIPRLSRPKTQSRLIRRYD